MDIKSDGELISAVQDGHIYQYRYIIDRYRFKALKFVCYYVRDQQEASDIVQDVFVKIYFGINRLDPRRKFSSYLYQSLKNQTFSYLRRQKVNKAFLKIGPEVSAGVDLFDDLMREHNRREVAKALSLIPPKFRKLLVLYYYHGLKYDQISRELNVPVNTVRTWLRRGKLLLRDKLANI